MTIGQGLQTFSAVCDSCGASVFAYHHGKDADDDPVWCTRCDKRLTFSEAEEGWHQPDDQELRKQQDRDPPAGTRHKQPVLMLNRFKAVTRINPRKPRFTFA